MFLPSSEESAMRLSRLFCLPFVSGVLGCTGCGARDADPQQANEPVRHSTNQTKEIALKSIYSTSEQKELTLVYEDIGEGARHHLEELHRTTRIGSPNIFLLRAKDLGE